MSNLAKMAESTWVGLGGGLAEGVNANGDQTWALLQAGVAMLTNPGTAGPGPSRPGWKISAACAT